MLQLAHNLAVLSLCCHIRRERQLKCLPCHHRVELFYFFETMLKRRSLEVSMREADTHLDAHSTAQHSTEKDQRAVWHIYCVLYVRPTAASG
jgi:hypothetical protein